MQDENLGDVIRCEVFADEPVFTATSAHAIAAGRRRLRRRWAIVALGIIAVATAVALARVWA